jgi:DNA polymerase-1
MANKVFVIIDGNSIIHRAFHAMPALTNKKGQSVGAVYGFVLALFRAVTDFGPDYIAACFDTKAPTFRHAEFKDYKAQRPAAAPELVAQIKTTQELLDNMGIAVFAEDGFEADDLIASLVGSARKEPQGGQVDFYVLTGDHDSLQLVDEHVKAFIINRGVKNALLYDTRKVKEIFGVMPNQIPALKALAGDASDNIPGASGIGPKAAVQILEKCGSLQGALESAQKERGGFCLGLGARSEKIKKTLLENKEKILRFEKLVRMRDDAHLGPVLSKCVFDNFNGSAPREALLELGLTALAKRLPFGHASRNGTLF